MKIPMWDLLIHGQDREQNFVKFFVKLCAQGLQILLCARLYSVENTYAPAFMNRLLTARFYPTSSHLADMPTSCQVDAQGASTDLSRQFYSRGGK